MNQQNQLTEIQERILGLFRMRVEAGLAPPTYREICVEFGWRSTGTARDHLNALVRKGALDPGSRRARGTHLPPERRPESVLLPIIGHVGPGNSVNEARGEVTVPGFLVGNGGEFLLRVAGSDMKTSGILAGDMIVVRRDVAPREGDIVVASLNGHSTLRRLRQRGSRAVLVPEDLSTRTRGVPLTSAVISGIVVGLFRTYGDGPQNMAKGGEAPPGSHSNKSMEI